MKLPTFESIIATATGFKGSREAVFSQLPNCRSADELAALPDSYFLSAMSRRIFQAGLKHSLVDARWPEFEQAFAGFDPSSLTMMSDDDLDRHMANKALIRHLGKMKSIRLNAALVLTTSRECGGFGRFLGQWPTADVVGLWQWLKRNGNQLGGMSGARFLRLVAKDTFLLTDDVLARLSVLGVVAKMPTAKRDLEAVQSVFNQWHEESGLPYCQISRILSLTADIQS
ncbi:DNA-3-methyladenine glycosylase I [Halioxenophilus sp. WMMB6]|uniref:DNA-3-methyladenine glycosylase I n=1 Tax=Halioxenophilus sp. WMMB6 TaxID=3073815 RepID=UPI00295F1763|nr:DNA-3-methyladenine glycosylase I [Halioxenophilus sp. WMMB6]